MGSVHSDTVPSASPAASRPAPSQASEVTGCGCGSVAVSGRRRSRRARWRRRSQPRWLRVRAERDRVQPVHGPSEGAVRAGLAAADPPQPEFVVLAGRGEQVAELNATPATRLPGPVSGLPSGFGEAGSATFHSRTVLSALPAARSSRRGRTRRPHVPGRPGQRLAERSRMRLLVTSRALWEHLPASLIRLQSLKGQGLVLYGGSGSRVSPVWARNPSMRAGRYWMRLSRFLTIAASWSTLRAARLPRPFFMFAQAPSAGLRSGA